MYYIIGRLNVAKHGDFPKIIIEGCNPVQFTRCVFTSLISSWKSAPPVQIHLGFFKLSAGELMYLGFIQVAIVFPLWQFARRGSWTQAVRAPRHLPQWAGDMGEGLGTTTPRQWSATRATYLSLYSSFYFFFLTLFNHFPLKFAVNNLSLRLGLLCQKGLKLAGRY